MASEEQDLVYRVLQQVYIKGNIKPQLNEVGTVWKFRNSDLLSLQIGTKPNYLRLLLAPIKKKEEGLNGNRP